MSASKLNLSKREKVLLSNADIFYLKNDITGKIYEQLALLVKESLEERIFDGISFPSGADFTTGKISKGENYLGLPYFMLDFPRYFSNKKTLAIRTMIWWGKFYSNTLLIDGSLVPAYRQKIIASKKLLNQHDVHWSIGESPWHHHFEAENMVPIKKYSRVQFKNEVMKAPFLKCARKKELKKIDELVEFSLESFRVFAQLLK